MEVRFRSRKLERCYRDHSFAQRNLGAIVARKYVTVISALRAVDSFETLKQKRPYRFHQLRHQHAGRFALDLTGNWRLIIEPTDNHNEFLVHSVEDYHER